MKRYVYIIGFFFSFFCYYTQLFSQNSPGLISGDFDLNMQTYSEDKSIGAEAVDEILLNNAYLNINYIKGNFSAGIRYESYLNALLEFDNSYNGNGIPYKYLNYKMQALEITAGNFYDQIGQGLIFRTYENKRLGVDNALDGFRVKYNINNSIHLKSFIGKSRTYFTYAEGIIRGGDIEININNLLSLKSKTKFILGQGLVSKFEEDNNPIFNLPKNVADYSSRLNIIHGNFQYFGEFATKLNDPIGSLTLTENNYAKGNAIVNNFTYSQKGLGIVFGMHRIDNLEFRSQRAKEKQYIINYIPTLTKQHTYSLLALYPCATQSDGEFGVQLDIFYKIKKGTFLGGKYGTKINFNFSNIQGLEPGNINDSLGNYIEQINYSFKNDYNDFSPKFYYSDGTLYFRDFNLEIYKKLSSKLKMNLIISKQSYNKDVLEGKTPGTYGVIESNIGVVDFEYKIKKGHTIKVEAQSLLAKKGDGSWSMGLIEYTISPNWFFAVQDMYNWGNPDTEKQIHYFNVDCGYTKGANRFAIGYGKKRAGIFCVGGICKEVPSSNGFNLSITSSF